MNNKLTSEDVVRSTLSEISMFLIFFFLVGYTISNAKEDPVVIPKTGSPQTIIRIDLKEGDGPFKPGQFSLNDQQREYIRETISKQIREISDEIGGKIVDVVGFTDPTPVSFKGTTLDTALPKLFKRGVMDHTDPGIIFTEDVSEISLVAADNVGLGMLRAASVARELMIALDGQGFTILPYSGGQIILPLDQLSNTSATTPIPSMRRVEIRVRTKSDYVDEWTLL